MDEANQTRDPETAAGSVPEAPDEVPPASAADSAEPSAVADAHRRVRIAAGIGFGVAIVTVLAFLLASAGAGGERLQPLADPWVLLDALAIGVLAAFVWRGSRVAACLLFAYYALNKLVQIVIMGETGGLILSAAVLLFFGFGIQGAFRLHRLAPPPEPRARMSCWTKGAIVVGAIFLGVFALLAALGVAIEIGRLPDSAVVSGDEVSKHLIALLVERELLEEDETILYYYGAGLFSFLEDGNFFTEDRVVSYADLDGSRYWESVRFEDVADISVEYSHSFFLDTVIEVIPDDRDSFILIVSTEGKKDRAFVKALKEVWRAKRPVDEHEPAAVEAARGPFEPALPRGELTKQAFL